MNVETYLSQQMLSKQWGDLFFSLAIEMEHRLDKDTLKSLMFQTGARMAKGFPVEKNQSLEGVEQVINEIWMTCNWGWITMFEGEHRICIEHNFSPLSSALGHQADEWAGELLTGFYASVFDQLSAGPDLQLRRVYNKSSECKMYFELSASIE